jgi:hypothetical protein
MSSSWTRAFGLSMILCLIVILAAPAMAANPYHGRPVSPFTRRIGTPGLLGHGMNILASFQVMGFPVVGPLAMLSEAKNVIQKFVTPSPKGQAGNFTWNLRTGWSSPAFNRSTLPLYSAYRSAAGAMEIGFAENLTAFLGEKGYDVADLTAALSEAHAALAGSNVTALGSAMRTFRADLDAKVTAGTIEKSVIQDYLKTLPMGNGGIRTWRTQGRKMRLPGEHFLGQ